MEIDGDGLVTIQFRSNATIAAAGTLNAQGKPRPRDLIATTRGNIRFADFCINMNVTRV